MYLMEKKVLESSPGFMLGQSYGDLKLPAKSICAFANVSCNRGSEGSFLKSRMAVL